MTQARDSIMFSLTVFIPVVLLASGYVILVQDRDMACEPLDNEDEWYELCLDYPSAMEPGEKDEMILAVHNHHPLRTLDAVSASVSFPSPLVLYPDVEFTDRSSVRFSRVVTDSDGAESTVSSCAASNVVAFKAVGPGESRGHALTVMMQGDMPTWKDLIGPKEVVAGAFQANNGDIRKYFTVRRISLPLKRLVTILFPSLATLLSLAKIIVSLHGKADD